MTEYERIRAAAEAAKALIVDDAPEDSGNLKKSIKLLFLPGRIIIYVDIGNGDPRADYAEGEAPYMKYTEEKWSAFAPPLRDKQNPNEGWFERAVSRAATKMASLLQGELR